MTTEATRKAWVTRHANEAHEVRDRYRAIFVRPAKRTTMRRGIQALVAAGGTVCLELWGGGLDIDDIHAAGLKVISVENGKYGKRALDIEVEHTRRAHALDGIERGFETRFGSAARYAHEADCALLDVCGVPGKETRAAIRACRHMPAIVVTCTSGHDVVSKEFAAEDDETLDLSQADRRAVFETLLKRTFATHRCRLLATYKGESGPVWVFLLSHKPISIPKLTRKDSWTIHPELRAKANERTKTWNRAHYWENLSPEKKHARREAIAACKRRRMEDPEYAARRRQLDREKAARWRALHLEEARAMSRASHAKRRAEAERHSES